MKFESVKKGVNLKSKEDRKNVKLEKQQHFGSCNIFDNSKQTSKNKVGSTNVFLWLIPTADVENIHVHKHVDALQIETTRHLRRW